MKHGYNQIMLVLLFFGLLLVPAGARADGGTVQAIRESGGLVVSVFTSPTVLSAGEVDISVLVQDAASRVTLVNADVRVTVVPRERAYLAERHEATANLATNRLMKVCHVQLESGWHDVEVQVTDQALRGQVKFAMLVGDVPTRATSFLPWFTWPTVPILLVAANLAYRRIRYRNSAIIHRSTDTTTRATP